jgi:hypothetical protein
MGRILVLIGAVLLVVGLLVMFADRVPFLGKLPGDVVVRKKNFTFYFPIVTSILVSLVLTLVLSLWSRR